MYKALTCEITIYNDSMTVEKVFTSVVSVNVNRSIHQLGANATITIPKTSILKQSDSKTYVETATQFKRGDIVIVKLGYNNDLVQEFFGRIQKINQGNPVQLECDDYFLYALKETNFKASYQEVTLNDLISTLIAGSELTIDGNVPNMTLSNYIINNASAAQVMQQLKDEYWNTLNIDHEGELYCGLEYLQDYGNVKYTLGYTTKSEDRLEYSDAADKHVKIRVINYKTDGSKVEKEVGEDGGVVRTVFLYDVKAESDADLLAVAEQELKKYNYTGYSGEFTAFLQPFIVPGMTAEITDPVYAERSGKYFVESVETNFGQSGAERIIEIGRKINE